MHGDPYPSRYYPRLERDPLITTAVANFRQHEPAWRIHSARLLLLLAAFYLAIAILFLASSSSHAANAPTAEPIASTQAGCLVAQAAGK